MGVTPHQRLDPARPSVLIRAALVRRMVLGGYRPETDGSSPSDLVRWLWKQAGSGMRFRILRSLAQALERRRRKRPVVRLPETPPPDSSLIAWLKAHGHGIADLPAPMYTSPVTAS